MWDFELESQTYHVQNKIGQGYTAQVYKATNRKKQVVCVKIINQSFYKQSIGKNLIDNEVEILSKLNHAHVIRFLKKQQKKKLMIITQYCSGGTLYQKLSKKGKFSQKQSAHIMRQLIQGCIYIHSKGYIHRDLKPENIFFSQKDKLQIKIADFGFAVNLKDTKLLSANVGSPLYMPFEALSNMKFSKQSDIFAIGAMWYELLTGKTPFDAQNQSQLKQKIKKEQFRNSGFQCQDSIKELILRCLRKNVSQRPSLQELLNSISSINFETVRQPSVSFIDTSFNFSINLSKQFKENIFPQTSHNTLKKSKRSITAVQTMPLKGVKKVSANQTKAILKNDTKVLNKQAISQSSLNFSTHLSKLIESRLSFLPKSIESKFLCVVKLYKQLLTGEPSQSKAGQQAKQDELIKSLHNCKTEKEFCITVFSFLRRLLRLARTYKQFGNFINQLSVLWSRVESICSSH